MKIARVFSCATVVFLFAGSAHAQIVEVESSVLPPLGLDYSEAYSIVSVSSKLCLDVVDAGTANGVRFQQWGCHGKSNQKYLLLPVRDRVYRLAASAATQTSFVGPKVLSVMNSSTADAAVVQLWQGLDVDNQELLIEPAGGGSYRIRFRHSDKCLDVAASSKAYGTQLQQWTCNGGDNQKFNFVRMESI